MGLQARSAGDRLGSLRDDRRRPRPRHVGARDHDVPQARLRARRPERPTASAPVPGKRPMTGGRARSSTDRAPAFEAEGCRFEVCRARPVCPAQKRRRHSWEFFVAKLNPLNIGKCRTNSERSLEAVAGLPPPSAAPGLPPACCSSGSLRRGCRPATNSLWAGLGARLFSSAVVGRQSRPLQHCERSGDAAPAPRRQHDDQRG